MPLVLGSKLGPYQLEALLHSDGRGDVYRGRDTRLGRVIAVKVLPVHMSKKAESREPFEREALALSLLDHPNICRLYDVGYQDGLDYLVMEYLEGENLAERLRRGPLALDHALTCAVNLCDGLDRAHKHGLIHRDLKPGTIMLTNTGAKLLDFGLAKLSRAVSRSQHHVVGTFNYFAPEQITGARADPCSNVFAAGAIIYEMATGMSPFPIENIQSFVLATLGAEPSFPVEFNSATHHALQEIICKSLQKKRHNRYQSAMEMLVDLQRVRSEVESIHGAVISPRTANERGLGDRANLLSGMPETTISDSPQHFRQQADLFLDPTASIPKQADATRRRTMTLQEGRKLGPFKIVGLLGAGGMGEVYRAQDTRLGRVVAVKILPEHLSRPGSIDRFAREARAISSLNHKNICQLYDVGHHDGIHYLVMECLEGEPLTSALVRGPLPLRRVLDHGIEVADALHAAHSRGIIHRDLKPSNLFLTNQGECKILDFGLAKLGTEIAADMPTASHYEPLSSPEKMIGTVGYMSPEQARGELVDGRTDIFSFGAVLYEMSTGRLAFPGKTIALVFKAIFDQQPPPLQQVNPLLPHRLDEIICRALEKDRDRRYPSASDLREELKRLDQDSHAGRASRNGDRTIPN